MTDLDELKRIALAATPGPWVKEGRKDTQNTPVLSIWENVHSEERLIGWFTRRGGQSNAAFIAAFNPSVALDLLHENAVLTKALSMVTVDPEHYREQAEREIAKEKGCQDSLNPGGKEPPC